MATVLANLKYMSNTYSCPGVFFKKKTHGRRAEKAAGTLGDSRGPNLPPLNRRWGGRPRSSTLSSSSSSSSYCCAAAAGSSPPRIDRSAWIGARRPPPPSALPSPTCSPASSAATPTTPSRYSIPPPSLVPRASRRACCCQTCAVRCGRRRLSREVGFGGAASIVGGFSWVDNERAVDLFQCSVSVSSETVKVANSKLKLWSIWVPLYVEWKVGSEDFRANLCFNKG